MSTLYSIGFKAHCTFPVFNGEVWVGGADAEDKLVSNEGLVRVNCTYRLNQL